MGTVKDKVKIEYCDEVLAELAFMIYNVQDLRNMLGSTYDRDSEIFKVHDRHLAELADLIDWKLQILTTAWPFDWKGLGPDVESEVSVRRLRSGTGAEGTFSTAGGCTPTWAINVRMTSGTTANRPTQFNRRVRLPLTTSAFALAIFTNLGEDEPYVAKTH